MRLTHRAKTFLLGLGDIIVLYVSLILGLFFRYHGRWHTELYNGHLVPFTIIFLLWIVVFYVAGLYDLRRLRNNIEFVKILALALVVNAALAITFFYVIPTFGITPKTNLFIVIVLVAIVMFAWRRAFNRLTALSQPLAHIGLVGESDAMEELNAFLHENPQLGFNVDVWVKDETLIEDVAANDDIEIIVVSRDLKRDPKVARALYAVFASGKTVYDTPSFYEEIFRKVPITEITEEWFLESIQEHHRFYDGLKRATEVLFSIILLIVCSPLLLLLAMLVTITSRGPIIYRQTRVGKNGHHFTLYKFRSMNVDAEKSGIQWAKDHDPRSTPIGNVLRKSHLDELPQLANILKGNLSFVGPRPERPEFVEKLASQVPYYETRLLINPGVTGWAQIHHHKDLAVEDVVEKLKYDIYYLKNRSIFIDIAIILKTIKTLFASPKHT